MKLRLLSLIKSFLTLAVGAPLNTLSTTTEVDGKLIPAGAMAGVMNAYSTALGLTGTSFLSASGTTATISNFPYWTYRYTAGSATTITFDSAYNLVNNIPNAYLGQTFPFTIITNASTTIATPTLSDTAVTLAGTTTVLAAAARWYQGQITQMSTTVGSAVTAGTTFTSIAIVGSTNNYTVTLGTNAITPVVGNAIYLNVTAGTLPAGWYPINKVTSATSFVIAAPVTGTTWTATTATVPGTIVIPSSAYSPNLPGLYSPLVTITGVMATVVSTMSV